jgi:hypothetical protein
MTSQADQIINTYKNRKEAEYAVKALVQMAGLEQTNVLVTPADEPADNYHVCVKGSEQAAKNARAFLQGANSSPQEQEEPQRSPYGLKRARDLMAMDDFG